MTRPAHAHPAHRPPMARRVRGKRLWWTLVDAPDSAKADIMAAALAGVAILCVCVLASAT